jgi:hypothetical protein
MKMERLGVKRRSGMNGSLKLAVSDRTSMASPKGMRRRLVEVG